MSRLVFVMPANDATAITLAAWGTTVGDRARAAGHAIGADLCGSSVDRGSLEASLVSGEAVFYFGHGNWDKLVGAVDLVDSTNAWQLAGKAIVAIACQAARQLGPDAVWNHGAAFFLGFDDDLLSLGDPQDATRFGAAIANGLDPVLNGKSAGQAEQLLRDGFHHLFEYYKYHTPVRDPNRIIGYLAADWDANHVCLVGSPDSSIGVVAPSAGPWAAAIHLNPTAGRRHGYADSDWDATKEAARRVLANKAVAPDPTIPYSDLASAIGPIAFAPDSPAFHEMLGEISSEEDVAGRGLLSVLVVHKDGDKRPGPGFFTLAAARGRNVSDRELVWIQELNRVVAYWSWARP